jgi:hypothetical protein
MRTNQFTNNYKPIDGLLDNLMSLVTVKDGVASLDAPAAKVLVQEFVDRALMGKA